MHPMEQPMQLTINGHTEAGDFTSVTDLLSKMELDPKLVVVELNSKILPKEAYSETRLREGDSIEIVQFVAGG